MASNIDEVCSALQLDSRGNVGDVLRRTTFQGVDWSPGTLVASVELTDAQIKALPTVPATILPLPGVGFAYVLLRTDITIRASAGAYGNVDGAALGNYVYTTSGSSAASPVSAAGVATLLTTAAINTALNTGQSTVVRTPATSIENRGIVMSFLNGALGNYTGGNVANSGTINVVYYLIRI